MYISIYDIYVYIYVDMYIYIMCVCVCVCAYIHIYTCIICVSQAATDPRTGRIDMDLINTGRSASSRIRTQQLVALLTDKLAGRLQSGSITFANLLDLVKQEQQETTTQELQAAVRQLADDDVIVTSGTGYNISIARGSGLRA